MCRTISPALMLLAILPGCGFMHQVGSYASHSRDPRSGYTPTSLTLQELGRWQLERPTTSTNDPLHHEAAEQCGLKNRSSDRFGTLGGGIGAVAVVAVGTMAFNQFVAELGDLFAKHAEAFSSNEPSGVLHLRQAPQASATRCFLAVKKGRAPGAKETDPEELLWAFAFTVTPFTGGNSRAPASVQVNPVFARLDRSAAETKQDGAVSLKVTVMFETAAQDRNGLPLFQQWRSDFTLPEVHYGQVHRRERAQEPAGPAQAAIRIMPAVSNPFPAAANGAFGTLSVTVLETGEGAEAFTNMNALLERHNAQVLSLMTTVANDRLGLSAIPRN